MLYKLLWTYTRDSQARPPRLLWTQTPYTYTHAHTHTHPRVPQLSLQFCLSQDHCQDTVDFGLILYWGGWQLEIRLRKARWLNKMIQFLSPELITYWFSENLVLSPMYWTLVCALLTHRYVLSIGRMSITQEESTEAIAFSLWRRQKWAYNPELPSVNDAWVAIPSWTC